LRKTIAIPKTTSTTPPQNAIVPTISAAADPLWPMVRAITPAPPAQIPPEPQWSRQWLSCSFLDDARLRQVKVLSGLCDPACLDRFPAPWAKWYRNQFAHGMAVRLGTLRVQVDISAGRGGAAPDAEADQQAPPPAHTGADEGQGPLKQSSRGGSDVTGPEALAL